VFLLLSGCGGGAVRHYEPGLLDLAAGASAKQVCSCIFVLKRDEDFCAEWTRVSPDIARFSIDRDTSEVTAHALMFGGASARFVDERTGCVLE
jgi:hypothetical protein